MGESPHFLLTVSYSILGIALPFLVGNSLLGVIMRICGKGFNMCMAQASTPIWSRASELAVQGLENKFELPAIDCMGMKKRWYRDSRQSAAAPFPSVFIGHLVVFANLTLLAETHIQLYPKLSQELNAACT